MPSQGIDNAEKRSKIILWIWNVLLFATIAICISCTNPQAQNKITVSQPDTLLHYTSDETNLYDDGASMRSYVRVAKVCKFEYSGHQYIQFSKGTRGGSVISVVHDPDCPCHQINQ